MTKSGESFFKRGASLNDLDFEESGSKGPSFKSSGSSKSSSLRDVASARKDEGEFISQMASDAVKALNKASLESRADEVKNIISDAKNEKFTVAVVGEFSRGKSTFINKLLGKDILPVANMPTTAILTRIRHCENEGITIFDAKNKVKKKLPLSAASWQNYVADDSGNDPNGVAFVNVKSSWLKSGIEIIDTPGAGDLEEGRAKLIGDALKIGDAAIITISALMAMSMSEKLFIEERLISKKTPFLMLIVTKLDQVEVSQRNRIVDYIKEKLKIWKFNGIKVFIPYDMEMPDDKYKDVMGMDKIVKQINSWVVSSDRKRLTMQWTALKLKSSLESAIGYAKECQCLINEEDAGKKAQMLEKKSSMIAEADKLWDETKLQMIKRGDECYEMFLDKVEDYKASLTEKLQYEISHISNPQKWWQEDFPYKLKIEMTNLSNIIESLVSRNYTRDTTWFNAVIEKNFKMCVLAENESIADRESFTSFSIGGDDVQLTDLSKSRNMSKIGLTALSLCAAMCCTAVGVMPIFATMGIGTGGSILSESIFKKQVETQRQVLKEEIKTRIPNIIDNATQNSKTRIRTMYSNVIKEATKQQENWVDAQKSVISSAGGKKGKDAGFDADILINVLRDICMKIDAKFPN